MNKIIEWATPYFAPALKWALMALGLFLALWFVHHDGYTKGRAEIALASATATIDTMKTSTKERNVTDAQVRKVPDADLDRELDALDGLRD